MIERLILEMKQRPGVWFCTCEELARYCIERFPTSEVRDREKEETGCPGSAATPSRDEIGMRTKRWPGRKTGSAP
jgi:hypothetical protein